MTGARPASWQLSKPRSRRRPVVIGRPSGSIDTVESAAHLIVMEAPGRAQPCPSGPQRASPELSLRAKAKTEGAGRAKPTLAGGTFTPRFGLTGEPVVRRQFMQVSALPSPKLPTNPESLPMVTRPPLTML
jgi:hypothetical protein